MFRWLASFRVFVFLIVAGSTVSANTGDPRTAESSVGLMQLPGHVLPALSRATPLPRSEAQDDQPITLTLVLRRDDQEGFDRYLRDVYDPRSTQFRHFLSSQELSTRFGPSQRSYDVVLDWLQSKHFALVEGSNNRAIARPYKSTGYKS
jgi:subtilase family serine protease